MQNYKASKKSKRNATIPKCKPSYFELNGNCTYYNGILFNPDDVEESLPG